MDNVEQERGYGRLEWFFYIVLLPVLFTILLTGILLSFFGYDVIRSLQTTANQIPFIERIVPDPKPSTNELGVSTELAQFQKLQADYEAKQVELLALQKEYEAMKRQSAQLSQENEQLRKESEERRASDKERALKLQELASLYSSISPSKAAPIIENLSLQEAVLVLSEMDIESRGKILEKMDAKKAADVSILLKDTVLTENRDIAALQERIMLLTKALSEPQKQGISDKEVAVIYAAMPPGRAAEVLNDMYKTSPSAVISILISMDRQAMSAVMAELPTDTAADLTAKMLDKY